MGLLHFKNIIKDLIQSRPVFVFLLLLQMRFTTKTDCLSCYTEAIFGGVKTSSGQYLSQQRASRMIPQCC